MAAQRTPPQETSSSVMSSSEAIAVRLPGGRLNSVARRRSRATVRVAYVGSAQWFPGETATVAVSRTVPPCHAVASASLMALIPGT